MNRLRTGIYIVLISCIPLLVLGCLEMEGTSVTLDLKKNTCTVIYYGLGSDKKEEVEIEEDFEGLIKMYNYYGSDKSGNLLSVALYPEGNKLNGKIVFRLTETFLTSDSLEDLTLESQEDLASDLKKDLDDLISGFREACKLELAVDETSYFIPWADADSYETVKGNGKIVQEGLEKKMKWPKNTKLIQYEVRRMPVEFEGKTTNFLPRWQKWSKENQERQMNTIKSPRRRR